MGSEWREKNTSPKTQSNITNRDYVAVSLTNLFFRTSHTKSNRKSCYYSAMSSFDINRTQCSHIGLWGFVQPPSQPFLLIFITSVAYRWNLFQRSMKNSSLKHSFPFSSPFTLIPEYSGMIGTFLPHFLQNTSHEVPQIFLFNFFFQFFLTHFLSDTYTYYTTLIC